MITLIVNPVAGNGFALKTLDQLEAELERQGIAYRVKRTRRPGEATELARAAAAEPECTAVWSVGGDGTAFETASGLAGTGVPFGIIPAGTGNDFIKSLGTPAKPMEAMAFILSHQPRPADIGLLNDGNFLNVCGTGFDVTVLDYAEKAKKRFRGLLPYMIGLIRAILHYVPVKVRLHVDGVPEEREVLICSVANGRYIGGGIPICPPADPSDGKLDLVLVDAIPRWKIPFYLPKLMSGRLLGCTKIAEHRLCSRVRIDSPGMRVNVDGNIFSMDAAAFGVQSGALMLYW